MDELITNVCGQLGIDEAVAKQAIGAILCFLKEQVADTNFDFDKVTEKLNGAVQLMNDAPKTQQEAATDRAADTDSSAEAAKPKQAFSIMALLQWILTAGPILEILKKLLGMFFGEGAVQMLTSASESADLIGILNNLGISKDTAQSMMSIMVTFMNNKLGPDVVEQLADNVPALKPFLDATKKDE